MFEAAQHISTWVSLLAFLVAAGVYAYRSRLNAAIEMVKQASAQERGDVVLAIAERFSVETAGLTQKQRTDIVIKQLEIRARRDMMILAAFVIVAVLAALITIVALLRPSGGSNSGRADATIHYKICIGEIAEKCPSETIHLACGTDEQAWAKSKCQSFGTNKISDVGGNKCGYAVIDVTCTGPA
ncbi:hypothetical protein [Mesorhizobium loti]|uniref:Uncharacterized protein n=1 Tax=Mesorhizobium loti R88b TaxID=935548 RepID=A0A6M7WSA3_RHILI|nr:hypothetical protein [Mesorhizobium loti]QKD03519.1 hypothetical protein EB235_20155 [Mesorhizobium loti R88b]